MFGKKKGVEMMLADIEAEVHYTRSMIGKDMLDETVMAAMKSVPRHRFVPDGQKAFTYANGPLSIGHGQTISQPYIVALMTDLLNINQNSIVLEIGTGSGYQCAVLASIAKQVYSVEIIPELSEKAASLLHELGYTNVQTCVNDGHEGWPEHAPFDGIIVTAAATAIPQPLIDQLKPGARLVIPVGVSFGGQELIVVEKSMDHKITVRDVLGVSFVPLVRVEQYAR